MSKRLKVMIKVKDDSTSEVIDTFQREFEKKASDELYDFIYGIIITENARQFSRLDRFVSLLLDSVDGYDELYLYNEDKNLQFILKGEIL